MASTDHTRKRQKWMSLIPLTIEQQHTTFLNGRTLYDPFHFRTLDALLESNHVQKESYADGKFNKIFYPNEYNHLKEYRDRYDMNKFAVPVLYKKSHTNPFGRVYAYRNRGLVSIRKEIRNTLIKDLLIDLDLKNAQLSILQNICEENGIDCSFLQTYNTHREKELNEIMQRHEVTRTQAKDLFIQLVFGGSFREWKNSCHVTDFLPASSFVRNFEKELRNISHIVYDSNQHMVPFVKSKKSNRDKIIRSVFSVYLQEWEFRIIDCCIKYLHENTYVIVGDYCVYEYDGLKLLRQRVEEYGGKDNLIRDLENVVQQTLHFTISFEEKCIDHVLDIEDGLCHFHQTSV